MNDKIGKGLMASADVRRELGVDIIRHISGLRRSGATVAALTVLRTLASAVAGLVLTGVYWWLAPLSILHVGTRGRALANLMHEAQHRALFRSPRANRLAGEVLAFLVGNSFEQYDAEHKVHHGHTGGERDPKVRTYTRLGLVRDGRPWTRHRLLKAVVRGVPGAVLERITSFLTDGPRPACVARITGWAALAVAGTASGFGPIVVAYLLAMVLVRPVHNMVTDVFNHAGRIGPGVRRHEMLRTRGFTGNVVVRYLFGAVADDMWHWVHHWCPGIAFWDKARVGRAILAQRPDLREVMCDGVFRSRVPGVRSVIDDVVHGLNEGLSELRGRAA
jgi:fatty acid desaturase